MTTSATSVMEFLRSLFRPPPQQKPHDVIQLEEAKRKLDKSLRRVAREANAFGQMLTDMQSNAQKSRRVRR
jgi:hypothetical protein